MKSIQVILFLVLSLPMASLAKSSASSKAPQRRTDIRFNGTEVSGKYQVAGEAVATVENEKPLIELIEPRREFKDRLRKSVTQR